MKRTFISLIIATMTSASLFAQAGINPSEEFSRLKESFIEASKDKKASKQLKEIASRIDEFLSHVKIEQGDNTRHNMLPFLLCSYDNHPLTVSAYLNSSGRTDTIIFQKGKWYMPNDMEERLRIDILTPGMNIENKAAKKLMKAMGNKHLLKVEDSLLDKNGSLFFVKDENLYYAAIESKNIPAFDILSNNEVINYSSCLKAILKASGIDATYDEIIRQYLSTTIDEQFVPVTNRCKTIAGRKVATTFVPQANYEATAIVKELLKERFMIVLDKNGNAGLLTAIALTGDTDYQPVHVRMRMPMLGPEMQRVQISWQDFCNNIVSLVKVDIY